MVTDLSVYEVVLSPAFLEDLEASVLYVREVLCSPLAAERMYKGIKKKVEGLKLMPQTASSLVGVRTGAKRYKVSYKKYDIYYSIDEPNRRVVVLGIKHQLQASALF